MTKKITLIILSIAALLVAIYKWIMSSDDNEEQLGGVRGYNEDKLYNKASAMKFRIFVGWQVRVCSNLCLTTDGYSGIIDCMTEADIMQKSFELFNSFNPNKENTLLLLENLHSTQISEEQFYKIIGRMKLYQYLPNDKQKQLPLLNIGDTAVNAMAKGYITNPNFKKKPGEDKNQTHR